MDLLNGSGLSEEHLVFFATGLGVGAMLWGALQSSLHRKPVTSALEARVAKIEMRLASNKDFPAIGKALEGLQSALPIIGAPQTVTLFSAVRADAHKPELRPTAEQIAKEFGEAMQANTVAAVEIAKSIIDQSVNLADPSDRRRVAARCKELGRNLSTQFWDNYGDLMLASGLPQNLKDLLKVFFAQVKRLKTALNELPKEPKFEDLDKLLDRAIDLLDTAKAIIDELERLSRQS